MNRRHIILPSVLLVLLLTVLIGCERPPLWVSSDEYKQVELDVDWSHADAEPGGMTALFFPDGGGQCQRHTTADVRHTLLGLPRGAYQGVVFSYSPEEYGRMEFTDLDNAHTASIRQLPLPEQPESDDDLYGNIAVEGFSIPTNPQTGMHQVSCLPEPIDVDTLNNMMIITGSDGNYVRYEDREAYSKSLKLQTYACAPEPALWHLQIIVYITGVNYLYNVKATVAGLADGYRLVDAEPTDKACLIATEQWEFRQLDDSTGYIATSIPTFGYPVQRNATTRDGNNPPLRLNLQIMLRDEATVFNYHYDLGPLAITLDERQLINATIGIDATNHPVLPYVDAKGSAGFGAEVTPWKEGDSVIIPM